MYIITRMSSRCQAWKVWNGGFPGSPSGVMISSAVINGLVVYEQWWLKHSSSMACNAAILFLPFFICEPQVILQHLLLSDAVRSTSTPGSDVFFPEGPISCLGFHVSQRLIAVMLTVSTLQLVFFQFLPCVFQIIIGSFVMGPAWLAYVNVCMCIYISVLNISFNAVCLSFLCIQCILLTYYDLCHHVTRAQLLSMCENNCS